MAQHLLVTLIEPHAVKSRVLTALHDELGVMRNGLGYCAPVAGEMAGALWRATVSALQLLVLHQQASKGARGSIRAQHTVRMHELCTNARVQVCVRRCTTHTKASRQTDKM
eukprot:1160277-Pelagomonas_calceolata.AAC.14